MNALSPFPHSAQIAADIEQMASALFRASQEAGLDLGDGRLVDRWLNAAMYSQGQILAFGEHATERARAKLQVADGIDNVACTAGIIMGAAALFFGWIGLAGEAEASVLTVQACAEGGDLAMMFAGMGIAAIPFALVLWLRGARVVAPCDESQHGPFDYRNARQ